MRLLSLCIIHHMCVYMYVYVYVCIHMCICMYRVSEHVQHVQLRSVPATSHGPNETVIRHVQHVQVYTDPFGACHGPRAVRDCYETRATCTSTASNKSGDASPVLA